MWVTRCSALQLAKSDNLPGKPRQLCVFAVAWRPRGLPLPNLYGSPGVLRAFAHEIIEKIKLLVLQQFCGAQTRLLLPALSRKPRERKNTRNAKDARMKRGWHGMQAGDRQSWYTTQRRVRQPG